MVDTLNTLKDIVKYKWQKDNCVVQCEPYVNYVEAQKLAIEWIKHGRKNLTHQTEARITNEWIKYFFNLKEEDLK